MCRFIGYLGPPISLAALLLEPSNSLRRQSYAPRLQDVGRINGDGWGVGWYDTTVSTAPGRYRTATPMWADAHLDDFGPYVSAEHIVAAVRNASPGLPVEDSGASPFKSDNFLFTHNGYVSHWHDGVGVQLRRSLSERRETAIAGRSDSEVVFAMFLDRIDKGRAPIAAVREVLADLHDLTEGRFNLLLSNGSTLVATRDGNSLWVRDREGALVVASEPTDDEPDWHEVPERSLVRISADDLTIEAL